MKFSPAIGAIFAVLLPITHLAALETAPAATEEAPVVLVVANRNATHSLELARHYLQQRNLPDEFLIIIDGSTDETISWDHFIEHVHNPILEACIAGGWMQVEARDGAGSHGRPPATVTQNRVDYLLLISGVPLRIENHPSLLENAGVLPRQFRTTRASVDSELATLPALDSTVAGFVPNPFFQQAEPGETERLQALRVSRLDGPRPEHVRRMIRQGLQAEIDGLRGRAYIDMGGPHQVGDNWLSETADILEHLGFDTVREETRQRFSATDRFDAPAFYFGWYTTHVDGPFLLPGFEFPAGTVGFHIHSTSAQTLRSARRRWTAPLIARGITATVGNVYEPYLEMSHRPHLLVAALHSGMTWGQATAFAQPVLSWQTIAIGDPLYQPFHRRLPRQVLPGPAAGDLLAQYAVIRAMNRLHAAGETGQALALGFQWFEHQPGIALALWLLALTENSDTPESRREYLLDVLSLTLRYEAREVGLGLEVAEILWKHGRRPQALELLHHLHSLPDLPEAARNEVDRRGSDFATRMGPAVHWRK